MIATLLAVYGVGGLLGNTLSGLTVDRHLGLALVVVPLIIAAAIIGFSLSTGSVALVLAATAVWGVGFGAIPTMSQTWVSRAEPNRVEAAGGLFVATFQFAIALGAALGGLLLDTTGAGAVTSSVASRSSSAAHCSSRPAADFPTDPVCASFAAPGSSGHV